MSTPALTEVAGWDVPLLRGAVWTFDSVAERLPAWRARMEAVGRSLTGTGCWYGPAAHAAGAALIEVSTVATATAAALTESLGHAQRLLADAATAQELAEEALAAASAVPVVLDGAGRLAGPLPVDALPGGDTGQTAAALRAEALGVDAVEAARRADLAAAEAAEALGRLGVGGPLAPGTFDDLAWLVAAGTSSAPVPLPPRAAAPAAVAGWWAALSVAARTSAIHGHPERIGNLEGLPAWARDRANRLVLGRVAADPSAPGHAVAASVGLELSAREAAGETVQLLQFLPQEELVALAAGDVDTADSVVVTIPGMRNSVEHDLDELTAGADALAGAALAAAPGLAVASVAWFGYRPPMATGALGTAAGREGGRSLDRFLDGVAASRGADPARVVISAHSYGTTVVDAAAEEPGALAADAVVLNGSPGMDNDAEGLEVDEVYEASSPADPITWRDWHGSHQTWRDAFGAVELPTGPVMMHTEYYSEHFPTLAAIGEVVAAVPEPR
ncbi:alpha/beta hydrolase [Geodermatophilus sp. SYSU D01186]